MAKIKRDKSRNNALQTLYRKKKKIKQHGPHIKPAVSSEASER